MQTYNLSNKGSLNWGGWKPGRNNPPYSLLSTNVCVVSPYCRKQTSLMMLEILLLFFLTHFEYLVYYRLKHSQPDFTVLVLQGVGLLYDKCTSLPCFLTWTFGGETQVIKNIALSLLPKEGSVQDKNWEQTCTRKSQSCTVNAMSFTPSPCLTKWSPISETR